MTPVPNVADGQPFLASEVMGFVLLVVAMLCAILRGRDHEPGMGWLACSFALLGAWIWTTPLHLTPGPAQTWSAWYLLVVAGLVFLSLGLIGYLGLADQMRRWALWANLVPIVALSLLNFSNGLIDRPIPRSVMNLPAGVWFLAMGALAWQAARREPGAGHRYIAAVLWTPAVLVFALALYRLDTVPLRFYGFFPVLVLALTMPTVSVLRRRRAIEKLNASLEDTVAQRTAELKQLVAALESFNRSVSHDLRGTLGGIARAAHLASASLQRNDDSLARQVLPLIAEQADNSTRQVAALLSLARIGDAKLERREIDLRGLVDGVVGQLAMQRGDRAMPPVEISPNMPQVMGDLDLLRAVFVNLIGNAIKFTRDTVAGRIEVGAAREGGGVEVFVRDNGVGFDSDAAVRLFTPFVRLHEDQFEGYGVGLSIVRRVVERHGGRVWAEGRPNRGAVFRFFLPN